MKFIVDAQLPKALARFLSARGFDAIHTLDLPNRNVTDDLEINRISLAEDRVVISKDSDFYNRPDLLSLFDKNLLLIIHSLQNGSVVELNRNTVFVLF